MLHRRIRRRSLRNGAYLSAGEAANDGFAHAVLGGAAATLKQMIVDAGIVPRGVVQDLSRAARSSNFAQSLVDVNEAYDLGLSAHMRSADPAFTGQVVGVRRNAAAAAEGRYDAEFLRRSRQRVRELREAVPRPHGSARTTRASPTKRSPISARSSKASRS